MTKKTGKKTAKKRASQKIEPDNDSKAKFKVSDKRFWVKKEGEADTGEFREESLYPTFIEELKAQKDESEKKLLEYIQAFKKTKADQEEFRERLNKDIESRVQLRKKELFLKLLDMLDNLDRAITSAQKDETNSRLLEGIILTRDHFLSILKSEGVERVETLGKVFDPNVAEAIMVEEEVDPSKINIVLEEIIPGYSFNEQNLRPAKVKVSVKSTAATEDNQKESE